LLADLVQPNTHADFEEIVDNFIVEIFERTGSLSDRQCLRLGRHACDANIATIVRTTSWANILTDNQLRSGFKIVAELADIRISRFDFAQSNILASGMIPRMKIQHRKTPVGLNFSISISVDLF
jgi:hypothetical protein